MCGAVASPPGQISRQEKTAHRGVATADRYWNGKSRDEILAGFWCGGFLLRLRRGFFPRARPLLSGPFARSGCFCLPLSRFFAFPAQLFLAQIRSELFVGKPAAQPCSSNRKRSCDLNRPLTRCHVPWTFVEWISVRKRKAATRCTALTGHSLIR